MEKPGARDLSSIDLRTVTPEQWEAIRSEIARGARAERAEALRALRWRLWRWWQSRRRLRQPAARTDEALRGHTLYWSGRV
jgi:hypothetical protein